MKTIKTDQHPLRERWVKKCELIPCDTFIETLLAV